jgi:putative ABC transport system permease protein
MRINLLTDAQTALRMLWRDWRGGQLNLVFSALVIAVSVVAAVATLADRIEQSLERDMGTFIASDLVIRTDVGETRPEVYAKARELSLETADNIELRSVVYAQNTSSLVELKAIPANYPLRGSLEIEDHNTGRSVVTSRIPAPGTVWLETRLMSLLEVNIGDTLEVGALQLEVAETLRYEPDGDVGISFFDAGRAMINLQDLSGTGLVLPGSRIRNRLLLAGTPDQIQEFHLWMIANLNPHEEIRTPANSGRRLNRAIERGTNFLLLTGAIGVILASIALALASQQYASRLTDRIALMKAWGQSADSVRTWLMLQILILGSVACLIGLAIGRFIHFSLATIAAELLGVDLPASSVEPYVLALLTGLVCIIGFALPPLWNLPKIAPLRVLRRDLPNTLASTSVRLGMGALAIGILVFWYANALYALAFLGGALATTLICATVSLNLLRIGRKFGHWGGSYWRLGFNNLWRRKSHTLLQLVAFSMTIMLLTIIVALQTSLIDDWKEQIPVDTPNYFLVNVSETDLETASGLLREFESINQIPWYPMVRGRISQLNGYTFTREELDDVEDGDREINFTWAPNIPDGNTITDGAWWSPELGTDKPGFISIENVMAAELGAEVGDEMQFSIGGLPMTATIANIREVNWDDMTPNFYYIFSPGTLSDFPATWLTSAYLPDDRGEFANAMARNVPTAITIQIDQLLNRIRGLIDRLSGGLVLIVWMVLACGLLVLFATIGSSLDQRKHESAILRTLGSSRSLIIGSLSVEFFSLGLLSAVTGIICAEGIIAVLQVEAFDLAVRLHPEIWPAALLVGVGVIGLLGIVRSLPVVTTPPLQSLRDVSA